MACRLAVMNPFSFLQVPIRLQHEAAELFERLAGLGMLCIRAKNLTAELIAIADPGDTVLKGGDQILFPG